MYLSQILQAPTFAKCCATLRPDVICEVGGFDGRDAEIFAETCPDATVVSFEANPENFFEFSLSERMRASRVSVQHIAISDRDGMAEIIVPVPPARETDHVKFLMRGMGSLLPRPDIPDNRCYAVSSRALDSFFRAAITAERTFALWVDAEGFTRTILAGASALLSRALLVKLELEEIEYWKGQALAAEIIPFMQAAGFILLATSDPTPKQYDALFLRRGIDRSPIDAILTKVMV